MTQSQYSALCAFRTESKNLVARCTCHDEELRALFFEAGKVIQTPVVYNKALDDFDHASDIRLILVGDNPGVTEQQRSVRRYLAGAAGAAARSFFLKNSLGVDFEHQVLVFNKTPFHTHSTSDLQKILTAGSIELRRDFLLSIDQSARSTFALQKALGCPIWVVGYGHLRAGGVFEVYLRDIIEEYFAHFDGGEAFLERVPLYLFQHFSMNCFLKDFRNYSLEAENLGLDALAILKKLGHKHLSEIVKKYREKVLAQNKKATKRL